MREHTNLNMERVRNFNYATVLECCSRARIQRGIFCDRRGTCTNATVYVIPWWNESVHRTALTKAYLVLKRYYVLYINKKCVSYAYDTYSACVHVLGVVLIIVIDVTTSSKKDTTRSTAFATASNLPSGIVRLTTEAPSSDETPWYSSAVIMTVLVLPTPSTIVLQSNPLISGTCTVWWKGHSEKLSSHLGNKW